ncbi:MAG: outer membrane protein transport protein [Myxococcales bacterium]|nr:outer membrane protein transport protein [Myxococcales bacterium]
MKQHLIGMAVVCAVLGATAGVARANTEPTAYDTRSTAMGLTGTSFIQSPAAIAINPANLEGIKKFKLLLNFNPLLVRNKAPLRGPLRDENGVSAGIQQKSTYSKWGFGPLGALFLAGRVHDRAVVGFGAYILAGYGSSFDNVDNIEGTGIPGSGAKGDAVSGTLKVQFFDGDFALGSSVRITDWLWIGGALRIPFAMENATLYEQVIRGIPLRQPVTEDLWGLGRPAGRIGVTIHAGDVADIGIMYRTKSVVKMVGDLTSPAIPDATTGKPLALIGKSNWYTPHALALETGFHFLDQRLLLAAQFRIQFAKKVNQRQTIEIYRKSDGERLDGAQGTIYIPFRWQNALSGKLGLEYKVSDFASVRVGGNVARSSTTDEGAQSFTPPGGPAYFASLGAGLHWDNATLDLATAVAWGKHTISGKALNVPDPGPPITDGTYALVCREGDILKVGCSGEYKVLTIWASAQLTYGK